MTYTKQQIIDALKSLNSRSLDIFKTKKENDFSLTQHGHMLLTASKLYSTVYKTKVVANFLLKPSALITMKKIFDSPYFIKGNTVFYFDEFIHTQVCLHGSLEQYIEHEKSVDKFNKK